MAIELQNRGVIPDTVMYEAIATQYNKRVADHAKDMGERVRRWTPQDVRRHFDECISVVPRIEAIKQYKVIRRIKNRLLRTEFYTVNDDGIETVNQKALDNYLKLEARSSDILKNISTLQKGDLMHMQTSGTAPVPMLHQKEDNVDNGLFDL